MYQGPMALSSSCAIKPRFDIIDDGGEDVGGRVGRVSRSRNEVKAIDGVSMIHMPH